MTIVYLEYRDEKSAKFWEITVSGESHTVRYGRIGSDGQRKTKTFANADEAQKAADKLMQKKLKKGYAEVDTGGNDPKKIEEVFMLVWVQDDLVEERAERLRELLESGVEPDSTGPDYGGLTPLLYAVKPRRSYYSAQHDKTLPAFPELPIVRTLIECGADPNLGTHDNRPLESAIEHNDTDLEAVERSCAVIRLLHELGAKPRVNLADHACIHPKMMQMFLDFGLDPEDTNDDGNTALQAVISTEREGLIELLLKHGARTDVTNDKGQTPLAMAKKMREYSSEQKSLRSRVIELLTEAGAPTKMKINATPDALPCDVNAIREAAKDLGVLDSFESFLEREFATYQELAGEMHSWLGDGDPDTPMNLIAAIAQVLGEPSTRKFEGDQRFSKTFFHHGDVVIDGSLYTSAAFIVTGELRVQTTVTDCGPDSYIVIAGDLHTAGVSTDGEFYIGGDLYAEQFVYGYYNDNMMSASKIQTPLLIADDHAFDANYEVEHLYEYADFDAEDPVFRKLLVDACFDGEQLTRAKLTEVVAGGGKIFRE